MVKFKTLAFALAVATFFIAQVAYGMNNEEKNEETNIIQLKKQEKQEKIKEEEKLNLLKKAQVLVQNKNFEEANKIYAEELQKFYIRDAEDGIKSLDNVKTGYIVYSSKKFLINDLKKYLTHLNIASRLGYDAVLPFIRRAYVHILEQLLWIPEDMLLKGNELLKQGIEKNDPESLYLHGKSILTQSLNNRENAKNLFKTASNLGSANASLQLGRMYAKDDIGELKRHLKMIAKYTTTACSYIFDSNERLDKDKETLIGDILWNTPNVSMVTEDKDQKYTCNKFYEKLQKLLEIRKENNKDMRFSWWMFDKSIYKALVSKKLWSEDQARIIQEYVEHSFFQDFYYVKPTDCWAPPAIYSQVTEYDKGEPNLELAVQYYTKAVTQGSEIAELFLADAYHQQNLKEKALELYKKIYNDNKPGVSYYAVDFLEKNYECEWKNLIKVDNVEKRPRFSCLNDHILNFMEYFYRDETNNEVSNNHF